MARKIGFFLCLFLCFGLNGSLSAQNSKETDLNQQRPVCSSPDLYKKVIQTVAAYTDTLPANTTLAKRHKALITTNIEKFTDVSVENFSAENDVNTANALITLKINQKIMAKDIVICRQDTQQKPLYLILYPKDGRYQGYILNLDEYSTDFEDISFIYP